VLLLRHGGQLKDKKVSFVTFPNFVHVRVDYIKGHVPDACDENVRCIVVERLLFLRCLVHGSDPPCVIGSPSLARF
jgi:hypothetical protein